jgi:preprotein translocase subunit SecB|tara:strand:+ start:151 stop:831 length:681 start_codon:yes stop_codon:yes gene_type:complete
MSDKGKSDKGKKKKAAAKETAGAQEPTLDAPAEEAAPAAKADATEKASEKASDKATEKANDGATDDAVGVASAAPASAPQIGIQSQYVKDLSFENPGAPGSLVATAEPPDIQVNVEVQARPLQNEAYEVALHITASGKNGQTTLFVLDLTYGAVCRIVGVPKESLQPVLLVECPRMLFPFARRVLSDATRDGGFPPLMLNPIDFLSLYRQQQKNQAAAAEAPKADA